MPSPEWILTANAAECRIFSHDKRFGPLTEVKDLVWPESRAAGRELLADRPGRSFDSAGEGRHAMAERVDVHEEESMRFAHRVADVLADARHAGRYEKLVLICAPRFLGQLREVLAEPVRASVTVEIDKDLTDYDARRLADWLRKELWEQ